MSSEKLARHYEGKKLAKDYAKHRPLYAPCVKERILEYLKQHIPTDEESKYGRMLDVGCGGGQSTLMFAPHFNHILGIDISEGQIATAMEHNENTKVNFELVHGNNFPVDDATLDLVTCATAVHWLDLDAFLSECDRALKPKGCVAIYAYVPNAISPLDGNPDADIGWRTYEAHSRYLEECKADRRNYLVFQRYQPIFGKIQVKNKIKDDGLKADAVWPLLGYKQGWSTLGEYREFMKNNPPFDPLENFAKSLKKLVNSEHLPDHEVKLNVSLGFPMILFHKE